MPTDMDLRHEGKLTHDLRHCNDPGCCTGTLIGLCRRCGQRVTSGTVCPGWSDPVRKMRQSAADLAAKCDVALADRIMALPLPPNDV